MAEFHANVEVISQPTDGQVAVYDAANDRWVPGSITAATVDVPQDGIDVVDGPDAPTAVTVATANAAAQGIGYDQDDVESIAALANALKVALNAAIADNDALTTQVGLLTDAFNALVSELTDAAVLSAP